MIAPSLRNIRVLALGLARLQGFSDPGAATPGVSYHRDTWPNGVKGMAMPHGALFGR